MARIATRTGAVTMMAVDYQVISSTPGPSFYSRSHNTPCRTGSGSGGCSHTCSVLWEIRFPNLEIQSPLPGELGSTFSLDVVAQTKVHIAQALLGSGPLSQSKHGCLNFYKYDTVSSNKAASSLFKIYKLAQQQTRCQWSHSVWQF